MSDNFAEGWVFLFGLIAIIIFVVVLIELPVLHWILRKTSNQNLQLVILGLALLPGYILIMIMGGTSIIFWSLLFITPVATLIPPFAYPSLIVPRFRFKRIVLGYIAVVLFGIFLLFAFLQSSRYWGTAMYEHPSIFNTAIFVGLAILDIRFAFAVYRFMHTFRPAPQVKDEKTA